MGVAAAFPEGCAVGIGSHQLLGSGDPGVARTKYLRHLGNALGAIGHGGDGLCAADLEYRADAAQLGGHQHCSAGAAVALRRRAQHALRASREDRGNRQHDHRRRQGRRSRWHIQSDGLNRARHALAAHARLGLDAERRRQLRFMKAAHIADGNFDGGYL